MKITRFQILDDSTIEDIEDLIKTKLGDKYTYKSLRKSNTVVGKLVNGSAADSITVIKNAYHRITVSVTTIDDPLTGKKERSIHFGKASLAGWLGFLHKEGGILGRIIIRIIYGMSDEIYDEVEGLVRKNVKGEDHTIEAGIGALFNRKKA